MSHYLINITTALFYFFFYRYIHISYLVPVWGYMGYKNDNDSFSNTILSFILVIIPVLVYNCRKNLSNFFSVFIYIFVYVPTIVTFHLYYVSLSSVILYDLAFLFAMCLFFYAGYQKSRSCINVRNVRLVPFKFWLYFAYVLLAIFVFSYGISSFKFVSFSEVYSLRDDNNVFVTANPYLGYVTAWLGNFFAPLFLSVGLFLKKRKYIYLGIIIALLDYMITGLKAIILQPFFLCLVYLFLKRFRFRYFMPITLLAFVCIQVLYEIEGDDSLTINMFTAVLTMRTLGIAGLLTPGYVDFFESHPYTYYTHINIVNKLTGMYPYSEDLGVAVWRGYSGSSADGNVMNANANFLVTDGVAACGPTGVVIVSIIFYLILSYMNKISTRHHFDFVCVLTTGAAMSLLNVSLFTALLSFGLLFCILFMRFSTIDCDKKNNCHVE